MLDCRDMTALRRNHYPAFVGHWIVILFPHFLIHSALVIPVLETVYTTSEQSLHVVLMSW